MNNTPSPIAVSVGEALRLTGLGRTRFYELIGSGAIDARRSGRRTLVLFSSLRQYIESLPSLPIK